MNSAAEPLSTRNSTAIAWPRERANRWAMSQGFWVICDQAVISLASFLTTVIVGRTCGSEALGVYVLAVTTFWLLAGIMNALVWTPYTSRGPRLSPARRAEYAGSITAHMAILTVAIAALLLTVALLPASWLGQNAWLAPTCIALIPFMVMMMLREHARRICLTHLYTRDLLMIDVPIGILQLAAVLVLARLNVLTAATALLASGFSCFAAVVWMLRRRDKFQLRSNRIALHWSYNLQFGQWLLGVSLAWLLGDSAYRWIVGWLHGLDAVGQLAAAQATVMFINPLLLTAHNFGRAVSANRFAAGGMQDLRRVTIQGTVVVIGAAGIAFLCLALVGGPLVNVIFGDQYAGLGGVVASLCLGMFARILVVPIDAAMVTLRRGRTMFVATVLQLAVIIGAGIPLVRWIGPSGVGYTMALAFSSAAALQWYVFLKSGRPAVATQATVA